MLSVVDSSQCNVAFSSRQQPVQRCCQQQIAASATLLSAVDSSQCNVAVSSRQQPVQRCCQQQIAASAILLSAEDSSRCNVAFSSRQLPVQYCNIGVPFPLKEKSYTKLLPYLSGNRIGKSRYNYVTVIFTSVLCLCELNLAIKKNQE